MKTIQDLNKLIEVEANAITILDNERRGGATREEWAVREKEIIKQRGKHKDEIVRLRRLILFVERTPEEGVRFMCEKLTREVIADTKTARRMFDPKGIGKGKSQIR